MTYHDLAGLSQIVAMAIFGTVMAGVLFYALRPSNKDLFDAAARVPLEKDDAKGGQPNGRT